MQGKCTRNTVRIVIKEDELIMEPYFPRKDGPAEIKPAFDTIVEGDIHMLTERLEKSLATGEWLEAARLSNLIAALAPKAPQRIDDDQTNKDLESNLMAALLQGDWEGAAKCSGGLLEIPLQKADSVLIDVSYFCRCLFGAPMHFRII